MASMELHDDRAGLCVQRGKQRGGRAACRLGPRIDLPGRIGKSGWVRSSAWIGASV